VGGLRELKSPIALQANRVHLAGQSQYSAIEKAGARQISGL
jgi:hypothetical protein